MNKKKAVLIGIIFAILLVIPLTIIEVQKQQDIRQRAAELAQTSLPLSLKLSPADSVGVGDTFTADLNLVNNTGKTIAALDITIKYDKEFLNLVRFSTPPDKFFALTDDQYVPGEIHYVAINFNPNMKKSSFFSAHESSLKIGTLSFRGLKEGKAIVSFDNAKTIITAKGTNNLFNEGGSSSKPQEYTITKASLLTGRSPINQSPPNPTSSPILSQEQTVSSPSTSVLTSLTCSLLAKPSIGKAPLAVTLNANTKKITSDPTVYRWDFDGDGKWDKEGQQKGLTQTHIYSQANAYNPKVYYEWQDGKSASCSATVIATVAHTPYQDLYDQITVKCFGKKITSVNDLCLESDIDKNGMVDGADYNTVLRNAKKDLFPSP